MKKISKRLQDLGINEIESDIYLYLLETGPSSILEISKGTKIKRSTVHVNVETLKQKGIVTETTEGARRKIVAEPPERLRLILEEKKFEVEKLENSMDKLIEDMKSSIPQLEEKIDVKIKYYEGVEAVRKVYDEILESPEVRAYVNNNEITSTFPENESKFFEASTKRGVKIYDLMLDTQESRSFAKSFLKRAKNYNLKFFPKDTKLNSMDYLIFGDSLALIQGGNNPSAVIIKNELLSENMRIIFDLLWGKL